MKLSQRLNFTSTSTSILFYFDGNTKLSIIVNGDQVNVCMFGECDGAVSSCINILIDRRLLASRLEE